MAGRPSAAPDIEHFLKTRSVDGVVVRDWEDLAREAVRVAVFQGNKGPFVDASKGYNRSFTYGETNGFAEWCVEIYADVSFADTNVKSEEGFDRVIVGAPLWVRTPSPCDIYLYDDHSPDEIEETYSRFLRKNGETRSRDMPSEGSGKRPRMSMLDAVRAFLGYR